MTSNRPLCALSRYIRHTVVRFQSQQSVKPSKTALFNFHEKHGGKMVDFGGYLLPVAYGDLSISASHLHTREHCSLFDVSHMLQARIRGKHRVNLIEYLTTADVGNLPSGKSTLSLMTHPKTGGILDDLMITSTCEDYLHVVANAARREHDVGKLLEAQDHCRKLGKDVDVDILSPDDMSLLALQGREAAEVLQQFCSLNLKDLPFMFSAQTSVANIPNCRVTRCGYTGEDGFEISVASENVEKLSELLLTTRIDTVKLAGLGARDSLRLEAGLCLYGSDLDETTTPVEASLVWLIAKSRRERKDFPGAEVILKQLAEGSNRRRIGLRIKQGPPARHGCEIVDKSGIIIGSVTSGGPAPSLNCHIAMGYVNVPYNKIGSDILVAIRGKQYPATVVPMPFIQTRYYKRV